MKLTARDLTFTALFVTFTILCAVLVRFGSSIVPFSLVPFAVVLAGAVLGKRLAALAMFIYILLGLIGVPVFATAPYGGFAYILKPTFGFLLSYIFAAFVVGWILEKGSATLGRYIFATIAGIIVIYLIGLPYLWVILNFYVGKAVSVWGVIKTGFLPFIIPDLIKAIVAAWLAQKVLARVSDRSISTDVGR